MSLSRTSKHSASQSIDSRLSCSFPRIITATAIDPAEVPQVVGSRELREFLGASRPVGLLADEECNAALLALQALDVAMVGGPW